MLSSIDDHVRVTQRDLSQAKVKLLFVYFCQFIYIFSVFLMIQKREDALRVGSLYMKFGIYTKAMIYFERYLKYSSENGDIVNELLKKCRTETKKKKTSSTILYGFQQKTIADVMEEMALREAPTNTDEATIWGEIVPDIVSRLFDQMDRGDETVSSFFDYLLQFIITKFINRIAYTSLKLWPDVC